MFGKWHHYRTPRSARSLPRRDSMGRFRASGASRPSRASGRFQRRDSRGRFVSSRSRGRRGR